MGIHCTTVNNLIREMAAELKLGVPYTCNLVSVWQSQNNSTEYPSIDELKSLITEQERANNEIGLAIPEYTMEKFDPNKPLARTSKDNKIILMELPEENPIGYFFDYINGGKNNTSDQKKKVFEKLEEEGFKQKELRELITNRIEAYNFLLWHEMSHVQYNDREVYYNNGNNLTTSDKIAIEARATKDAWLKARVYRHKHSITEQQVQQQTQQQEIQNISNKTAAYGVVIDPNLKDSYVQWQRGIPKGIVAYRVNYNKYNTSEEALAGRIGNPFSENTRDKDTVQQFYDWLVTGNNFGNNKATEEYRQAIINKIMNTPNGSPILYYKELGRPSHATVLGYLISNKQLLQQSTQQNNLPGPETKINIYAGTNENADLSNFAERPFTLKEGDISFDMGERFKKNFYSVEQAFQYLKAIVAGDVFDSHYEKILEEIENTKNGAKLKRLGRSLPVTKIGIRDWDEMSTTYMYELLKTSFEQNPQSLQRLLATGNATLTHTQDKGKWGTEFPKLLMEVRDELRGETPQIENNKSTLTTKQALDRANGFIGEVNESPYSKQGNRFVLKSGTPVLNALKVVMDRGHKPEKSIFGDVYDGQVSYNLGYSSGSKAVMAVTNRDLFDEGWEATDILLMRESERYGQPLESQTTTNIEGEKQATFLVNENDKILIDYLENKGYKYELYTSAQQQSIPASYEGMITPNANTIFVFGSNPKGIHGAGAAATAKTQFGAIQGQGEGLQGSAYALPTKDLDKAKGTRWYRPGKKEETEVKEWYKTHDYSEVQNHPLNAERTMTPQQIIESIKKLYEVANQNPDKQFKVSHYPFGQLSLNGYLGEEMLAMFKQAGPIPSNVVFNKEWTDHWNEVQSEQNNFVSSENKLLASYAPSVNSKVNNNNNSNTNVNDITKVPEIGTEVIDTNKENPRTKLAKDYNSVTRHDRVVMLARMFSKKVDAIVKEKSKEVAREMANELSKSNPSRDEIMRINARAMLFNDGIKGRRAAMEDATIKKIFESMREDMEEMASTSVEDFEEEYGEGTGEHMVAEYNKILDNWYALLDEACIYIEKAENVRVTVEEAKEDSKEVQGKTSDSTQDEDTNDAANNDDEDGERAEGNGGWSFKVRFVDPRTSLSKDVKKILNSIVRFNSNGEIDVDDLGNTRYLDSEVAHAALINHLSNMIDADDFCVKDENGNYTLPALQKVAVRYPWVNQVINALKHNPSAISAFYADFRKDFIPYWTQIFDKDEQVWKTVALNSPVALDSVMSEVTQNYEHGDTLEEDSLYTKSGKVNPKAASTGLEEVNNALSDIRDYDSEDDTEIVDTIVKNLRRIGFNTNKTVIGNLLNTENGVNDVESVLHRVKRIYQESVNLDADAHLISSLNDDYSEIAKIIGLVSELNNVQSFREGDKTYYSYSAPNYIDTLVKTIKNDARRNSYIEKEFGFTEWFRDSDGEWMSEWVNLLLNDEDVRFQFDTKELLSIDGKQYTDWEPWRIKKAFILEYFSLGTNKGSNKQYAWYNIPILSDSPVAKFIKFKRYTGKFVEQLLPLFRNVVKQELWRIKLVQDRAAVGASPIGNFDVVGTKFHFFPELNANNNEFLKNVTELKKICKKTGDASAMNDYIDRTILSIMNANFEAFLETNLSDENKNEIANTLIADGTIKNVDGLNAALEEYFWNQAYATTQIIELTTTDLAFYKDGTDFQKRYKEVYAAGTKLNTNSPYGRKVERTIYLTDDEITSNSYLDIKKSLDDAVKLGHITASERDNILSKFKEVNVADAQAYRSISSMRAVLDMMGAWDDNMQKSYDRIKEGKWEPQDFNIVWQTIKPFVFTQIQKPDGLGGTMKVSHQNKNSEFLLLALHNVIASSLSKSPKLRAINRFMEKHNIDVIQFESAVKAGKQGRVNINYSKDKLNTWAGQNVAAYNEIESAVTSLGKDLSKMSMYEIFKLGNDTLLDQNKLTQKEYNDRFNSIQPDEEEVYKTLEKCALQENGEYNPTVVHELPYSDYSIQQPTPEHLFDVEAVFGSQFRNLILSDIPEDAIIKVNGKDMTKKEVVYLYHSIVVENLLEDYKKVAGKFSSIESLQKALLDSVKGNSKYGRDMLDALQLVEITDPRDSNKTIKVFNIPLDNPNTTTKIQELVTSMFKNAVTKQHIKGGACILVSSYGHSNPPQVLHNEDGSIKGIECYLPAYSKQFYAPFMVTKHTEEGEEYQELDINKMPLELRRLVGYRIPTEDKYSMAPLIVKGFLPQQNGSAIMLPADITQIAGSDYDVDKLFLMIPEFRLVNKYNIKDAWKDFYASHPDISKKVDNAKWEAFRRYYERVLDEQPEIAEEIDVEDKDFRDWFIKESGLKTYDLVDNIKDEFAKWFDANKNNYITGTEVAKINYNTNKLPQEQSRQARNNMLIDISYGILTHKDTAEKIHNPGNFDKVKIAARIANIISNTNLMYQFAEANNIPIYKLSDEEVREAVCDLILKISSEGNLEVLDKFMKDHSIVRSQLTVDTFIYNHKQNMTGGKLIGIYANNTTMQAKYQASNLAIKKDYTFTINGRVISSLHDITAANGERISKNCANFSAASVDNVKDPVLADLMQNTDTAYITGFMLRAGMSIEEIGLLFSQPAIRRMVKSYNTLDAIDNVIEEMMDELRNYGGSVDGNIRMHNFTSKELLMNCLNDSLIHNVNGVGVPIDNEKKGEMLTKQIEALLLMRHIMYIAEELNNLTSISRADSPNGAISTSIAGSKLQRRKVEIYNRRSTMDIFPIAGVSDASRNNYVSVGTDIDTMREKLLSRRMPMLQTFYSLGIDLSGQILSKYFSQTSAYSDELVDTLCDNADGGTIKEKMLNNMYSELVEFALSKTRLFGDDGTSTFDEKRNYYLNEFYKTYIRVLAENPDIASLNIFKKMTVDENNTIVMLKSGRITPSMKESLMRDFDTLLDSDNPAAQKLAIDLFMYAYYKEGFKFGPNSFGNFFSSNFISSFPEFIDTLRTMKYDMQKGSYFDRFLPQFYANHLNEGGLVPGIKGKKKGDIIQANGMVSVKASLALNENIAPLGVYRSYPYIRIGRSIFALQQEGKDRVIYVPALVFGSEQKRGRVIYNANKKVEEMSLMSAINSAEEETSPNKVDTPLTGLENSNPYSTEEGQGELKEPLC